MFLSKATGKGKRLKDYKAYKEELEGNPKIAVGVMKVIRQNQDIRNMRCQKMATRFSIS